MLLHCRGYFDFTPPNLESALNNGEVVTFDPRAKLVESIRHSIKDNPSECGGREIAGYLEVAENDAVIFDVIEYILDHIYDFRWLVYDLDIELDCSICECFFVLNVPTGLIDKLAGREGFLVVEEE